MAAPQDDEIESLRDELGAIETPEVAIEDARRRLAEATGQTQELRERMATLRGRLQERTARDGDVADIRDELETTAARLSEVETERAAAEQRLDRARARRREANAVRDRRLELEDRIGNLERDARATLVDRVRERYETALREVPDGPEFGDPFAVPAAVAALAIARIGRLVTPIVYDGARFETATRAAVWLGTPVVLC
jgi:chromosome segregation ATPase